MSIESKERELKLYIQNLAVLEDRLRVCGAELARERSLDISAYLPFRSFSMTASASESCFLSSA